MTMMAGKNQAVLAVCAQTKVIFPFKRGRNILKNEWDQNYLGRNDQARKWPKSVSVNRDTI